MGTTPLVSGRLLTAVVLCFVCVPLSAAAETLNPGDSFRLTFTVNPLAWAGTLPPQGFPAYRPDIIVLYFPSGGVTCPSASEFRVSVSNGTNTLLGTGTTPDCGTTFITSQPAQLSDLVANLTSVLDGSSPGRIDFTVVSGSLTAPTMRIALCMLTGQSAFYCSGEQGVTQSTSVIRANQLSAPTFPVVFVHGTCSNFTTWATATQQLRERGWRDGGVFTGPNSPVLPNADFYAINFSSPIILNGLDAWSLELSLYLARIRNARAAAGLSTKVVVVAHSAGGLAARGYLQGRVGPYRNDIHHLITYGTPHNGTPGAAWRSFVELSGPCVLEPLLSASEGIEQMIPGSAYLQDLNRRGFPPGVLHTSLVGLYGDIGNLPCDAFYVTYQVSHDCVVPSANQDIGSVQVPPPASSVQSRLTTAIHFSQTSDFQTILWAINRGSLLEAPRLSVNVASPVDISVTDPNGKIVDKTATTIELAKYEELVDANGDKHDQVTIPIAAAGEYRISVIPDAGAAATETFSITVQRNDVTTTIARNVEIAAIPEGPYEVVVPERRQIEIRLTQPVAVADAKGQIPFAILSANEFDPVSEVRRDTIRFGATGKELSLSSCLSVGPDLNSDGIKDLMCLASTRLTGLKPGATDVKVEAQTMQGGLLVGSTEVAVK